MMIENILIVCVGNICRSPMAEAVLLEALKDKPGISVRSAGLGALVGFAAADHSLALMCERNLDISRHRARQITAELVSDSDLILVMESRHKRVIDSLDSTARGKVYRLCEWQGTEIPDPYQRPRKAFEDVLELIDQGVQEWAKRIKT